VRVFRALPRNGSTCHNIFCWAGNLSHIHEERIISKYVHESEVSKMSTQSETVTELHSLIVNKGFVISVLFVGWFSSLVHLSDT
jgi:hypothetical protein